MARIRTFVAAQISERMSKNAERLINRLSSTGVKYNWMHPENMHLTLNFFGDIDEKEILDLCRDIKGVAEKHPSFDVTVGGMNAFPEVDRPRIVWLGVDEGADCLKALNHDLAGLMSTWGIPKDRNDYLPHLTLGRVNRGGRWNDDLIEMIKQHRRQDLGGCHVGEIVVYSSHLDRFGPTYTPMTRVKLAP